jgi:hypothetical protein
MLLERTVNATAATLLEPANGQSAAGTESGHENVMFDTVNNPAEGERLETLAYCDMRQQVWQKAQTGWCMFSSPKLTGLESYPGIPVMLHALLY